MNRHNYDCIFIANVTTEEAFEAASSLVPEWWTKTIPDDENYPDVYKQ